MDNIICGERKCWPKSELLQIMEADLSDTATFDQYFLLLV